MFQKRGITDQETLILSAILIAIMLGTAIQENGIIKEENGFCGNKK